MNAQNIPKRDPGLIMPDIDQLRGRSIAIDGRYLARPGMGIHTYVTGLISCLQSAGASVTALTNPAYAIKLPPSGVDVISFGGKVQTWWEQVQLAAHLRSQSYDMYWAPANNGVPLLAPRRQKIVVTQHDLIPLLWPREWFPRQALWGLAYFISFITARIRADFYVAPSEYTAAITRKYLRKSAFVCPPIVTIRSETQAVPAPTTGYYILYHGGSARRKRVDTVLGACEWLRNSGDSINFVLLGGALINFAAVAAQKGISDLVLFTGHVSNAERDEWVRNAVAVVYPSEMEGFGLPILEAMTLGVPVVTSPNSALQEVGGDAALYVDPNSPEDLARAIQRLRDDNLRAQHIRAGKVRAGAFSAKEARARTIQLCSTLISAPPRG